MPQRTSDRHCRLYAVLCLTHLCVCEKNIHSKPNTSWHILWLWLQLATNDSKGSAGQPMMPHTIAKPPGQSLCFGAMSINISTPSGSLIKPTVLHVLTASAASISQTPDQIFLSPFLGICYLLNNINASQLESTLTSPHPHTGQTSPRTMCPLQCSWGSPLCFQPMQICPHLQILWRRSSCFSIPPLAQKMPAKC